MRKLKRKKVILAVLEDRLAKYERRIQRISEESYNLRQLIEQMKAKAAPKEVAPIEPAEPIVAANTEPTING